MSASDLNLILKERKNNIPDAGGKIPDLGLALGPSLMGLCQILDKNHEHLSESGRYGSIWCHIETESIPRGLGSLWDASRPLKPP